MVRSQAVQGGWWLLVALLLLACWSPLPSNATEQYAACTGKACGDCHLDPAGGGALTKAGRQFAAVVADQPENGAKESRPPIHRPVRLVAGFVHLLTGIFWFGTILYVHLILKPTYAAKGLPKSEMRLGLVSMAIMAITGAMLTIYRVPSLAFLTSTRFGILLLVKIGLFCVMVGSALVVVLFVGPRLRRQKTASTAAKGDMTAAQLVAFDGKEGRPAYIAYQGVVYDVTASKLWLQGTHMARHQAGADLTEVLAQAPHDEEKVSSMPKVGKLLTVDVAALPKPAERLFYFMAYMNLGMVGGISLIIALWRWW